MEQPHVSLVAVVKAARVRMKRCLPVIDGEERHFERICPLPNVHLMSKRGLADESSSVDVKDDGVHTVAGLLEEFADLVGEGR